jgi:chemotaxis receptor (MCP) glutamine deamidase CheD
MFPGLAADGLVGDRNVARALELLGAHGIAVRTRSVGGAAYRRIAWTIGAPLPSVVCVDL